MPEAIRRLVVVKESEAMRLSCDAARSRSGRFSILSRYDYRENVGTYSRSVDAMGLYVCLFVKLEMMFNREKLSESGLYGWSWEPLRSSEAVRPGCQFDRIDFEGVQSPAGSLLLSSTVLYIAFSSCTRAPALAVCPFSISSPDRGTRQSNTTALIITTRWVTSTRINKKI